MNPLDDALQSKEAFFGRAVRGARSLFGGVRGALREPLEAVPAAAISAMVDTETVTADASRFHDMAFGSSMPAAGREAPVHAAAIDGDVQRVAKLLALNAALIDTRDERGMTPLALAAWYDHIDLVEFLIDQGADRDGHAAQRHGVYAGPEGTQRQNGSDQREGDGQ